MTKNGFGKNFKKFMISIHGMSYIMVEEGHIHPRDNYITVGTTQQVITCATVTIHIRQVVQSHPVPRI